MSDNTNAESPKTEANETQEAAEKHRAKIRESIENAKAVGSVLESANARLNELKAYAGELMQQLQVLQAAAGNSEVEDQAQHQEQVLQLHIEIIRVKGQVEEQVHVVMQESMRVMYGEELTSLVQQALEDDDEQDGQSSPSPAPAPTSSSAPAPAPAPSPAPAPAPAPSPAPAPAPAPSPAPTPSAPAPSSAVATSAPEERENKAPAASKYTRLFILFAVSLLVVVISVWIQRPSEQGDEIRSPDIRVSGL